MLEKLQNLELRTELFAQLKQLNVSEQQLFIAAIVGLASAIAVMWGYLIHLNKVHDKEILRLHEDHNKTVSRIHEEYSEKISAITERYAEDLKELLISATKTMSEVSSVVANNTKVVDGLRR